jgi:hypothetical protein
MDFDNDNNNDNEDDNDLDYYNDFEENEELQYYNRYIINTNSMVKKNEFNDEYALDIESYEYRLLLGAKETITKFAPKLAICIYHNSVDFYSIPLLLRSLNSSYKFSLRHYSPNLSETILYAYK